MMSAFSRMIVSTADTQRAAFRFYTKSGFKRLLRWLANGHIDPSTLHRLNAVLTDHAPKLENKCAPLVASANVRCWE
jgi:hypothetical protein